MITIELTNTLLSNAGLQVDNQMLSEVFDELKNLGEQTPFESLQYVIRKLGIVDLKVCHTSTSQLNNDVLPGIIFLDGHWHLIEKNGTNFLVTDQGTLEEHVIEADELPVTVVTWLERRQTNFDSYVETETLTTRGLIMAKLREHPVWLVNIAIATVVVNVFAIFSSMFAMQVYDRVVPTLAMETLTSLCVGILIVHLVDWVLKTTRSKIVDHNASFIDRQISETIYKRLMNIRLDKLPNQLGTLTAQINGLESVRQFFSSSIVFTLVDMPFAIMFLGVIYLVGGPIAYVYGGFLFVSIAVALIAQKRCKDLAANLVMRSNEKVGVLVDSIRGRETIRTVGSSQSFEHEWNEINNSISKYSVRQKHISTVATTSSQTLGQVSYVLAIVIGVYLIGEGQMTMGAMIACAILGGRVLGPVGQAVNYLVQYESVAQSMKMIDMFWAIPEQREPNAEHVYPDVRPNYIGLHNVNFAYGEEGQSIVDIDELHIQQGERIALLGSIGSGKSTLLKLLAGIYQPTSGRIRMGEADLWELDPDYIAKNVGYLPQSPDLFKGTLKSNLSLGRDISDTKILSIVNMLGIDQIAEQNKKGLDLEISEGGSGLSGGQRQLVGVARLFVGNASVWLLDEPTASLDPHTQAVVLKAIQVRMRPTDILVFATHNPKLAIELSTRVVAMSHGRIKNDAPTEVVQIRSKAS